MTISNYQESPYPAHLPHQRPNLGDLHELRRVVCPSGGVEIQTVVPVFAERGFGVMMLGAAFALLAGGSLRTNTRSRSEHDLPAGSMLIQVRGGGGGDSTSVECLFSIIPSHRRAEEEEEEDERRRRYNVGRVRVLNIPPALPSSAAIDAAVRAASAADVCSGNTLGFGSRPSTTLCTPMAW